VSAPPSALRAEWFGNWPLVMAAVAGMSQVSMPINAMGLFMEPMEHDLGWARASTTAGMTMFTILAVPLSPFLGIIVDRVGPRRLAVPGALAAGLCFAAFGLTDAAVFHWVLLWVAYTAANLTIKTTVWTTAVSQSFSRGRGMALAITLSGAALAQVIAPLAARLAIDRFGWRHAFAVLGLTWAAVVFLLALLFFRVRNRHGGAQPVASAGVAAPEVLQADGLRLREALRDPTLLRIAVSTLISATMLSGLVFHQVPILGATGMTRATAAQFAALGGIAGILGKLACGWLQDRGDGRWLGWMTALLGGGACVLFPLAGGLPWLGAGASICLGYAIGAYLQICVYYTTRYAGLRAFGAVFGSMSALIALGGGLGPMAASLVHDHFHGYGPYLSAGMATAVCAALLMLRLPPYPIWPSVAGRAAGA
jgi:MFS family permease